jgi:hypothetical protein
MRKNTGGEMGGLSAESKKKKLDALGKNVPKKR